MKSSSLRIAMLLLTLTASLWLTGCGGKEVTRIDVDEEIDLSGDWNDTDSKLVSADLTAQIMAASWVEDFRAENGKKPYLIIGTVRNKTPEHIAVKTFIADLERQFINGGRARVVASAEERDEVRGERADQQEFSSQATMKQWGKEKGADFMFVGEINAQFDQEGGAAVKYYQVDCYLIDLEDNTKVWAGFKKIKKFVGQGKYRG